MEVVDSRGGGLRRGIRRAAGLTGNVFGGGTLVGNSVLGGWDHADRLKEPAVV